MKKILQNTAIVLATLGLCFVLLEIFIRVVGSYDQDGQFYFLNRRLLPYKVPITQLEEQVDAFQKRQDESLFVYDAVTGWSFHPDFTSKDGLYQFNSTGIRADREFVQTPPEGIVRIALFGDSYTAGDEVPLEQSWAYQLQTQLGELPVEIMNFGVNGYGQDQAYLKWQSMGRDYQPDIVILGFQPENMYRNLNILPVYQRFHVLPLTKPRFIVEDGALKLVNSPPVPPAGIVEMARDFESSPLAPYEAFLTTNYVEHWWLQSKLVSLFVYLTSPPDAYILSGINDLSPFTPDSEFTDMSRRIVDAFAEDVQSTGATFIILHLPHEAALTTILNDQPLSYRFLLDDFETRYTVLYPETVMAELEERQFLSGGHYSPALNTAVGAYVAAHLRAYIQQP